MKTKLLLTLCVLLSLAATPTQAQKLKDYFITAGFTFLAGASDGLRDASMYRMDGRSNFWNGKQSWYNKYKNRDIKQGPAYWGSTNVLVFTTDAPHLANFFTHQFNGMALAYMPQDNNKKLGHIFLKVLAYNAIRQVSHTLVYDVMFKPRPVPGRR